MQRLFYRESQLVYDAQLDKSFGSIEDTFMQMQNFALDICINDSLQEILRSQQETGGWDTAASRRFDEIVTAAIYPQQQYTVCVYPVTSNGDVCMKNEDGVYEPGTKHVEDYILGYGFLWEFRPHNNETVRATRNIFDKNDPTRQLGIVTVDLTILKISEVFWTFSAHSTVKGKLYLLDADDNLMLPYSSRSMELSDLQVSDVESVSYELRDETITVVRPFPQNGWKLVCVLKGSSMLAGSKSLIMLILWVGTGMVVLGIVLSAIAAHRLTQPIISLVGFMDKSSEKKQYDRIPVSPSLRGEMRILYESYNSLMEQLQLSMDEIRRASEREIHNEFLLLQAQINPHFLYNTLDSIGWIAVRHGANEIRDMVVYLVGMFRNSLNSGNAMIKVQGEIEQVRCYLNIMMIRYPNRYTAVYDVEDGVEDFVIIKLLLQPLVENALQHGFFDTNQTGCIKIRAFMQEGDLVLEVCNNGKPADLEKIRALLELDRSIKTKHYGIRNVDERLRTFYGEHSRLRFRYEDGFTIAQIRIPGDRLDKEEVWNNG